MDKRFLTTLSVGHICVDLNQGALPALLPFLIMQSNLTYEQAAGFLFAAAFASSIVQPLFGLWADKTPRPFLMPLGLLMAGGGISTIGFFTDYWIRFFAIIVSGLGIAAFHPEAARLANVAAGEKKGSGMSIFSFGGNLGFALGPAFITPAILFFELNGTAVLLVPAITMAVIIFLQTKNTNINFDAVKSEVKKPLKIVPGKDEWGKFSLLTVAVMSRSVMFFSLNMFLPLYWINVLGQSTANGATALTVMLVSGALSTLIGGAASDKFGFNNVIRIGFIILLPLLYVFTTITNPLWAMMFLVPIAFALFVISSPMIVLGQKYLPNRVGFASGITMGLAISVGGMVAPFLGKYADSYGLASALNVVALIPLIGIGIFFFLKEPQKN